MDRYLAIDIGANSGRHILGELKEGKIELTEVYRFENGIKEKNGFLCWDIPSLFEHVVNGIKVCVDNYAVPKTIGIDTWGVDFVLLNEDGDIIGDTVAYRDTRTDGMDIEVEKYISQEDLYSRTGIQKMLLNSIYQLMSINVNNQDLLKRAVSFLLIPDYLNYLLTGAIHTEYTNASTTSLLNVYNKQWDFELIEILKFPRNIFGTITFPGTSIGSLCEEVKSRIGADIGVMLVATHDTASAFVSIPSDVDDSVFISSGTWSLLGLEIQSPIVNDVGRIANFTNEGGYEFRYRYLKNYMGLWMIQSVRRDTGMLYSYTDLAEMARKGSAFGEIVDVNDQIFVAPRNMLEAVTIYLEREGKETPKTLEESLYCIYHSLAVSYMDGVKNLESITEREFKQINIVGGGCQDAYLNELTAKITGLKVVAGPVEATAIGNLLVQMIANKEFYDLTEARKAVKDSFKVKEYLP